MINAIKCFFGFHSYSCQIPHVISKSEFGFLYKGVYKVCTRCSLRIYANDFSNLPFYVPENKYPEIASVKDLAKLSENKNIVRFPIKFKHTDTKTFDDINERSR